VKQFGRPKSRLKTIGQKNFGDIFTKMSIEIFTVVGLTSRLKISNCKKDFCTGSQIFPAKPFSFW